MIGRGALIVGFSGQSSITRQQIAASITRPCNRLKCEHLSDRHFMSPVGAQFFVIVKLNLSNNVFLKERT
jgi:hypothetical protein